MEISSTRRPPIGEQEYSLYFHVPFCTKRCPFCHFYVLLDRPPSVALYMEALEQEWQAQRSLLPPHAPLSLYLGGGTPSLLGPAPIGTLLSWVDAHAPLAHAEITLEANPENLTPALLKEYKSLGINRLSIGAQSFDDLLLRQLGRTHSAKEAEQAVHWAYDAGFENLSIDLMYDIPQQEPASWERSLQKLSTLPLSHLSLYNLTIEPKTPFYRQRAQLRLPPAAWSELFLESALSYFQTEGWERYEISAFCREGRRSCHNVGYWTGRPFLGFGPSAFSYWKGERFQNVASLKEYAHALREGRSPVGLRDPLPEEARRRELLAIQLRLCEGVALEPFEKRAGPLSPALWTTLRDLCSQELLACERGQLSLTERGRNLYDSVAELIIE